MRVEDIPGIDQLSAPEKILLVEELWDHIAAVEFGVPVPESHLEELDRRLKRHKADPGRLLSFAELQRRVDARK